MKKRLLGATFALALLAPVANADSVYVRVGPPHPPREVVVVRPSPRHVWVPGYYRWSGADYRWVSGRWVMPPRPRAVWMPGYWAPRHGAYIWIEGRWR